MAWSYLLAMHIVKKQRFNILQQKNKWYIICDLNCFLQCPLLFIVDNPSHQTADFTKNDTFSSYLRRRLPKLVHVMSGLAIFLK